jgi:vacuolar-type H+-ATPase subunit I/STV1
MKIENENSEIRSFSLLMGGFLIIFGLLITIIKNWQDVSQIVGRGSKFLFLIAFIFIVIGIIIPHLLRPIFKFWMGLSNVLGKFNNKVVMALIFYLGFTPYAYIMRLMKKDYMNKNFDKEKTTYWEEQKKDFKKESLLKQY